MSEWGLSWLELSSYLQEERVELAVRESPEDALQAIRDFLDEGPFFEVTRTDKLLEMQGPLVEKVGFWGCLVLLILSFGTAFAIWLAFFVAMLVFPKPTVIVEATPRAGQTHLKMRGRPTKTIALTEKWVRENMQVV